MVRGPSLALSLMRADYISFGGHSIEKYVNRYPCNDLHLLETEESTKKAFFTLIF